MAWYFIFLNFLFAAIVVGGICGSHLWAIATQHRDWPAGQPKTAGSEAPTERELTTVLVLKPAIG
jgi:hypothetical protein